MYYRNRSFALLGPCCAFCFFVQILIPGIGWGQSQRTPLHLLSPEQIKNDIVDLAQLPLQVRHEHYLRLVGATGITVGVMSALDGPIHRHFGDGVGGPLTPLPHYLSGAGRVYDVVGPWNFVLGTAGTFAAAGVLTGDHEHLDTSVRMVEAVVLTHLITGALKQTIGRARPFTGNSPIHADVLEFEFDNGHAERSMPSGHVSKAFAAASVIAHRYDSWWVKVPVYATAVSIGVQRIDSGNHWFSDVAVGAALGYFIGRALAADAPSPAKDGRLAYKPIVSFRRAGLAIRF